MSKLKLEFSDVVSETLLIPLWARAVEQRESTPLVSDPVAAAMVEQIDYAWRRIRVSRGDLVQCVVRLREFDRFVRDFLARHPESIVVHLGCGLDARFQRVDNGLVRWFDLDLQDVIDIRRRLLPESDRNQYVAGSVFDSGWMEHVGRRGGEPMLVVAEAVLPYFEESKVKGLILALVRRFPGAELVTDVCSPHAVRIDNLHLRVAGSSARMQWGVRHPRDLEGWSPGIKLVESFSYFDDPEPRMGFPSWFGRIPVLRQASSLQRYQLGTAPSASRTEVGPRNA